MSTHDPLIPTVPFFSNSGLNDLTRVVVACEQQNGGHYMIDAYLVLKSSVWIDRCSKFVEPRPCEWQNFWYWESHKTVSFGRLFNRGRWCSCTPGRTRTNGTMEGAKPEVGTKVSKFRRTLKKKKGRKRKKKKEIKIHFWQSLTNQPTVCQRDSFSWLCYYCIFPLFVGTFNFTKLCL